MQNLIKNLNKGIRKAKFSLLLIICFLITASLHSQTKPASIAKDTLQYEQFESVEGDSTYVMKKYFLLTYLKGPNRDQAKEETEKIQSQHLAHMDELSQKKKICIAGPYGHDGKERGIIIFNAYTIEEAERLAKIDPAIQAGRLTYTLHPIWLAKGSTLF